MGPLGRGILRNIQGSELGRFVNFIGGEVEKVTVEFMIFWETFNFLY